jgi:hypothetical protein
MSCGTFIGIVITGFVARATSPFKIIRYQITVALLPNKPNSIDVEIEVVQSFAVYFLLPT